MTKGQIISGEFGKILMRQKSEQDIDLGELLIADSNDKKILMQVYDLIYGSQISQQNLELISGLNLEENTDMDFIDPNLRNYKLALLKSLIAIDGEGARIAKTLPGFFSTVRERLRAGNSSPGIHSPRAPLFVYLYSIFSPTGISSCSDQMPSPAATSPCVPSSDIRIAFGTQSFGVTDNVNRWPYSFIRCIARKSN